MKTRLPCPWPLLSLLGWLALTPSALAQRTTDDPYQYPDEEDSRGQRDPDAPYGYPDDDAPVDSGPKRKAARRPEETDRDFREAAREDDEKKTKGFRHLSGVDDPNTGIAFEALGGVMLLSSARGQFLGDPVPAFGGRFTWEYGRILNSEPLREALWLDVRYSFVGQRDGTALVAGSVQRHYATLAPAYEFTFGEGSDYGLFLQAGGGVVLEQSRLEVGGKVTPTDAVTPLIQYGLGLRGRTQLSIESNLRLAWRLEVTRFRRSYQDDTFAGLSAGLAF